ncbi:MAG: PDZ domain-containing protein, partial [Anaerolineae bacterium]|nr:PDZ domain-containing protein [Anaerolineae bacterium]
MTMRLSRIITIGLILVAFGLGYVIGTHNPVQTAIAQESSTSDLFTTLFDVYDILEAQYIDDFDTEAMINGAIKGMVEVLDDPYTNYVDPEYFPYVSQNLSGSIEGIGVVISENDEGLIEIMSVLENTPAQRSGLQAGDIFVTVNGEDVTGLTYLELSSRVRGPAGSTVEIEVQRGDTRVSFTVERARIEIPNVEYEVLDGNIGYIKLAQFSSDAREKINQALDALDVDSLNGLVFDLRDNPGGYLSAAVEIAGLFLEDGVVLVEEFGDGTRQTFEIRDGQGIQILEDNTVRPYVANAGYFGADIPVVVLVNGNSASASELVAGAWQDNGTV